jgi:hypothetical protein
MFHVCAGVLQEHFRSIFVSTKEGRRLIADILRRAGTTEPPERLDLPSDTTSYAAKSGEVVIQISKPRPRDHQVREVDMLPDPIPGRVNIRLGVVDDHGDVVDMELGNAPQELSLAVTKVLIDEHAASLRKRQSETS